MARSGMTRAAVGLLLLLLAPLAAFAQERSQPDSPLIVESFECRGNSHTSCSFILGQLYLSEGDRLDEEEIQNAKLRLMALRNFSSVSIWLEKGSQRGRTRVVVEVVEASPITGEITAGFFSQNGSVGQHLHGRWTDYNLFGNGKILDFKASAAIPIHGYRLSERLAQLSYVDPHLFDSKRNFFSADLAYLDLDIERLNGDLIDVSQVAIDAAFGRRLWDFSYLTVGYQYRPISDRFWRIRRADGQFDPHEEHGRSSLIFAYGWNSEDNRYFPTRGSALQFTLATDYGRDGDDVGFFYRNTWTTGGGTTLTASFDLPQATRIEIARSLKPFGDARQARAFLQLGARRFGQDERGDTILSGGVTAGVRFDSRKFGIVTLYVLAETSWTP
jgi:outer membrane protein assembly factor BamA